MLGMTCRSAKAGLSLIAVMVLGAACLAQSDEPKRHDLRLATPKGTTVWFVESSRNDQQHELVGKDISASFQLERTFGITIKQVDKRGNRIIEIQIARVRGWTQIMDGERTHFDSNDAERKPGVGGLGTWAQRMMTAVGRRYIARIDQHGKIVGSLAGVAHEMGGDHETKVQDWELADLAETAFGCTPEESTAVGGSWDFQQSGTDAMRVARHGTMTLTDVDADTFGMQLSGKVKKGKIPIAKPKKDADPDSAEEQIRRANESMEIKNGKLTGRQVLSRKDGLVVTSTSKATFDVDMNMANVNQQIAMTIETTLKRTNKPDKNPRTQKRPLTVRQRAMQAKAEADTKVIAGAVRMYYVKNGALPANLGVLAEKDARGRNMLERLPQDPWSNDYKLDVGDQPRDFQILSAGPDGKFGTEDDISSKRKKR